MGTYYDAERYPFNDEWHPGISVSGDGRGCNQNRGSFTVRDIAYTQGTVTRLDLSYVQYCEAGQLPPLFGQIVIGKSAPASGLHTMPRRVDWPLQDAGEVSRDVPVTVRAVGTDVPTSVLSIDAGVHPEGDSDAFSIVGDTCPDTLTAGAQCSITLSFDPTLNGVHTGSLKVGGDGAQFASVPLSGIADDGISGWRHATETVDGVVSSKIDVDGFTPADFTATGDLSELTLTASSADEDLAATLTAPVGEELTAGTTYSSLPAVAGDSGGFDLNVNGIDCPEAQSSVAVHQIEIDPDTDEVLHVSLSYKHQCTGESGSPAGVGAIGYDATFGPRVRPSFGEVDGVYGTEIVAELSTSKALFGNFIQVNGYLQRPDETRVEDESVDLLQREVGTDEWDVVASANTSSGGYFGFQRFAAENTSYRVDFSGSQDQLAVSSETLDLMVRRRVIAQGSTGSVDTGERFRVFGHIEAREAAIPVEVQYLNRRANWRTLATDVTGDKGRFGVPIRFERPGSQRLRVVAAPTQLLGRGVSDEVWVSVS